MNEEESEEEEEPAMKGEELSECKKTGKCRENMIKEEERKT